MEFGGKAVLNDPVAVPRTCAGDPLLNRRRLRMGIIRILLFECRIGIAFW
jgi:hypothetical protein